MWGPPMWGFGWIFPLVGLSIALVFVVAMIRFMSRGGGFACMGGHRTDESDKVAALSREVRELREEIKQLKASQ